MARFFAWIPFLVGVMASGNNQGESISVGGQTISIAGQSVTVGGQSGSGVSVNTGSGSSTIIIISSNNGGSSQTQTWNKPSMQAGTVHQVTVGGDAGLVYTPDSVQAAVGDMIQFNFMSKNHTVTQSSFAEPCVSMEGGVDSGFMPNANNTINPPPTMMFQVMTTSPVWMYCRQEGHCGKGMVFSVNPTADKSQATFKSAAISINGTSTDTSSAAGSSAAAVAATSVAVAPAASASVVQGSGTLVNGGGACDCSCLCGVNAFPANAGLGMFGGVGGSMPLAVAGQKRSY